MKSKTDRQGGYSYTIGDQLWRAPKKVNKSPLQIVKSEKVTVTLTLGQIDALVAASSLLLVRARTGYAVVTDNEKIDLTSALQTLDEAVNL